MDAPSPDLPLERSFYIGIVFGAMMFGVQMFVSFQSVYLLRKLPPQENRMKMMYITYTIVLLLLSCMAYVANALMGQFMWIERRSTPGGPVAWYLENSAIWFNVLGSATDVAANFMGDSLLLYRCYIMWSDQRWVLILPGLLFLSSNALAIISVIQSALPGSSFLVATTINFAVPWISLACAFNAFVTALIAGKIIYMQSRMHLGLNPELKKTYSGVIAILVESALPFTVLGITFAILLGIDSAGALLLAIVWGTYVGIAPQLIILRVAMGRAWTRETVSKATHLQFRSPPVTTSASTAVYSSGTAATTNTKFSSTESAKIGLSQLSFASPESSESKTRFQLDV